MHVWHDVAEVDAGLTSTVVTIGNYDGVHLGHQHLLQQAKAVARDRGGIPLVVVTFDPHPLVVIAPDVAPAALTSLGRRIQLLEAAGADAVLILRFTPEMAAVSAKNFAIRVLFDGLRAEAIVVGENFRFGHRALGNVELLRSLCASRGVDVIAVPLDGAHGRTWSSSYIRSCIANGDVRAAAEALGRDLTIDGYVVRGDQRGRELGYPTANVPVSITDTAVPADGVYAGFLRRLDRHDASTWPAAISVGTNPTFDGLERRVESYVLDRTDLELYGIRVEVTFVERLRGMVKFDSVDDLLLQMRADVSQARALVGSTAVDP